VYVRVGSESAIASSFHTPENSEMSCLIRSLLVAEAYRHPDRETDELLPWLIESAVQSSSAKSALKARAEQVADAAQAAVARTGSAQAPDAAASSLAQSPQPLEDAALDEALREASLPVDLRHALRDATLEQCYAKLRERPAFLAWLATRGVALAHRQALANHLQRRRRAHARSFGAVATRGRRFEPTEFPSTWPYSAGSLGWNRTSDLARGTGAALMVSCSLRGVAADFARVHTDDAAFYDAPRFASHVHDHGSHRPRTPTHSMHSSH
jgi:hypothetical protein